MQMCHGEGHQFWECSFPNFFLRMCRPDGTSWRLPGRHIFIKLGPVEIWKSSHTRVPPCHVNDVIELTPSLPYSTSIAFPLSYFEIWQIKGNSFRVSYNELLASFCLISGCIRPARSFVRSFVRSSVRSLVRWFVRSFVRPCFAASFFSLHKRANARNYTKENVVCPHMFFCILR